MSKLIFLSFAAGSDQYNKTLKRITAQASKTNIFDEVIAYDLEWLMNQNEFWEKHKDFITNPNNKKGYGFYLWKPYLIRETFKKLNQGDVLVWCDAGCEIHCSFDPIIFKKAFIEEVNSHQFLAVECNPVLHYNQFTKGDVYKFFNTSINEMIDNKYVYFEANRLFFAKNEINSKIIEDWYEIMSNNYNLFDGSQSHLPNPTEFKDSRHDQMIFNFVLHKHKVLDRTHTLDPLISPVFRAYRSRTGISRLCEKFKICVCSLLCKIIHINNVYDTII